MLILLAFLTLAGGVFASLTVDPAYYKDFVVSRGINYHYYFSAPQDATKPYLLFLHGFPSSSYDWRYQIEFFSAQGYGVVVPDMLGYGGTDKPLEVEAYKSSLISEDLVEILDHEDVGGVVAVGHDWGAKITGRLANYYQDRFIAFAFYAVGYLPPPGPTYEELENQAVQSVGYNQWGYWAFFSQDDAAQIIRDHIDSFFTSVFGKDPRLSITAWSPTGALQASLESNATAEIFISQEEYDITKSTYAASGIAPSLNWYKVMTSGIDRIDNEGIPASNITIFKPVFYGGGSRDYVCVSALMRAPFFNSSYVLNFTFQDYDSDHWIMLQRAAEMNEDLLVWIEGVVSAGTQDKRR